MSSMCEWIPKPRHTHTEESQEWTADMYDTKDDSPMHCGQ